MSDHPSVLQLKGELEALSGRWRAGAGVQLDDYYAWLAKVRDLELTETALQRPCLNLEMGGLSYVEEALRREGQETERLQVFQELHAYALGRSDSRRLMRATNALAMIERWTGQYDSSLAHLLQAYQLAQELDDAQGQYLVMNSLAGYMSELYQFEEALKQHKEALALAEQHGFDQYILFSLGNLIEAATESGQTGDLAQWVDRLLALSGLQGGAELSLNLMRHICMGLVAIGRYEEALKYAQERLTQEGAVTSDASVGLRMLMARALRHLERLPEALAAMELAYAQCQTRNVPWLLSDLQWEYSALYRTLGEYEQALNWLELYLHGLQHLHEQRTRAGVQARRMTTQMQLVEREMQLERQRNADLQEINEKLLSTQQAFEHQATHDDLTGVLNRWGFQQQVEGYLAQSRTGSAALLVLDIDEFKTVNDLHGYAIGDALLKHVVSRLRELLGEDDWLGRMGGDEFLLFVREVDADQAAAFAQQVLHLMQKPFYVSQRTLEVQMSIGWVQVTPAVHDYAALQHRASLAMVQAKRTGHHEALAFESHMQQEHQERLNFEQELRRAVTRDAFELHYQALFRASGGPNAREVIGAEALIRWPHARHGLLTAGQFIPLAEESGLILALGNWVVREACAQAAAWSFAERGLLMFVNVSPMQFEQPDFVKLVKRALQSSGLPPANLVLELTEGLVLRNISRAQEHLQQLRALGVQVALDDFGTGYSSLGLLQTLPFNHLKLDRSFLQSIRAEQLDAQPEQTAWVLMETMIGLAHRLGMKVTGEGVEQEWQMALLQRFGCDHAQGFLLAAPENAEMADSLLGDHTKP